MSIKVMSLVWENSRNEGRELLVLLALADWADDSGRSYPGLSSIAKKARVGHRTAQRAITILEKSGELEIQKGKGRPTPHGPTNAYRVRLESLDLSKCINRDAKLTPQGTSTRHPKGCQVDTPLYADLTPQGVSPLSPLGVSQVSPNPSLEPSVHPSGGKKAVERIAERLAVGASAEPFPQFTEFRKEAVRLNPGWSQNETEKLYQSLKRARPKDWKAWVNTCALNAERHHTT